MTPNEERKERILADLVSQFEAMRRDGTGPSLDQFLLSHREWADDLRALLELGQDLEMLPPILSSAKEDELTRAILRGTRGQSPNSSSEGARSAGDFISKQRRKKGLRVADIASELQTTVECVQRIEADKWQENDKPIIERIFVFFGLSLDVLESLKGLGAPTEIPAFYRKKGHSRGQRE